jgi:hypothetical protein
MYAERHSAKLVGSSEIYSVELPMLGHGIQMNHSGDIDDRQSGVAEHSGQFPKPSDAATLVGRGEEGQPQIGLADLACRFQRESIPGRANYEIR